MKYFALFLLMVSSFLSSAQCAPDSIFPREKLIEDIYKLKSTILDSHPNPYLFCTKQEFNAAFGKAAEAVTNNTAYSEFILIVAEALRVIKDSHTSLDYGYILKIQTENGRGIIPIKVHSVQGQIYTEIERDSIIPVGSKIHCIDNVDASILYKEAMQYGSTEGNAITGQRRISDALFYSVIGLNRHFGDTVKIDYEPYGSDDLVTAYFPLYKKDRLAERQKKMNATEFERLHSLKYYNNDSVAVLKIGTFSPSNLKHYQTFIRESFKKIQEKNVQLLAIDLRNNGGGRSSNVEFIYSFLKPEGHNTPANIISKSSELAKSRSQWARRGFVRWSLKTFKRKDEDIAAFVKFYEAPNGALDTVYFKQPEVQKKEFVYQGKCALFINGMTASAGVDFTNTFHKEKRGDIIGEPCLGPHTGTFGNPAVYELPNTKLPIIIATIRYNYDNTFQYNAQPIKPHIAIDVTQETLAKGIDPCLEYLLSSFRKK
jgi:C-terminal processing protease CtpA/Prc